MNRSDIHLVGEPPQERDATRPSGGGGNGRDIEARLIRLETKMEFLATREDIQKIKVWCMSGVIGGIVLALAIARYLFP